MNPDSLAAQLGSAPVGSRFGSARLGLARYSLFGPRGQIRLILVRLGALFSARFVSLSLALTQGSARAGLVKSIDLLMSYKSESTYQSSRPGSARGSAHRTSGLGTVCSRHGSARGSAHRTSGLGSAHYSPFSLPRLVDLDRLGDRLEARRISSMLISAELRAWLRAQFGSLSSAWCIGSARGSARTGSPAQLEARSLAQGSALDLDRSPARLISARSFILSSLWFGSALAWSWARAGLVKSVDLLMSYKSESSYPHGQSFWEPKRCF